MRSDVEDCCEAARDQSKTRDHEGDTMTTSASGRAAAESLVQRYYDAFNRHETEAMLACLSDDIAHDVNQGARRIGKDRFRSFCAHMDRCYREHLGEIIVMTSADGRRAAAEFIVEGAYLSSDEGFPPATGQTYRLPAGAFLDIENGLITRITTYYNLQEWLRQVK